MHRIHTIPHSEIKTDRITPTHFMTEHPPITEFSVISQAIRLKKVVLEGQFLCCCTIVWSQGPGRIGPHSERVVMTLDLRDKYFVD
ncbi:hypothetical protein M378DRAFT_729665 [Amanita muscaria Koide BX008]|uniref:Uncharacterized protein n=1 Tax=Amanita muscaria (strain Koide BX008) TaxID=946122 RepID=A0A0C2T926_AMAMK|nr:hypothetical protein M378DRAFT_729665 [Amanita muscaria Koide BX008]